MRAAGLDGGADVHALRDVEEHLEDGAEDAAPAGAADRHAEAALVVLDDHGRDGRERTLERRGVVVCVRALVSVIEVEGSRVRLTGGGPEAEGVGRTGGGEVVHLCGRG